MTFIFHPYTCTYFTGHSTLVAGWMEPSASWAVHCSTGDAAGWRRGGDTDCGIEREATEGTAGDQREKSQLQRGETNTQHCRAGAGEERGESCQGPGGGHQVWHTLVTSWARMSRCHTCLRYILPQGLFIDFSSSMFRRNFYQVLNIHQKLGL